MGCLSGRLRLGPLAALVLLGIFAVSAYAEEDLDFKRRLIEHNKQRDRAAKAAQEVDDRKLNDCRNSPSNLIGLTYDELKARCSLWSRSSTRAVADATFQTMTWTYPGLGPLLIVTLKNGKVATAQGF